MPIVVLEKLKSRSQKLGDQPSVTLEFAILGTNSDADAHAALIAALTPFYGGLPLLETAIEPVADNLWDGSATYGDLEEDTNTYSFETGGGTQHITQSLETMNSYAASGTPPNFGGAIGVTRDSVEGCDIIVPTYNWSEEVIKPASAVDGAYKAALFALTGKTNNATFRGFNAGEVLFLGASGTKRTASTWSISFKFVASPNVTGLSVGPITGIAKGGHEYLWVLYGEKVDVSASPPRLVKIPLAVYVERVYQSGSYSGLAI